MTDLDPTLILLGLIMPPIVAVIKQTGFSKEVNSLIALVVYLAATVLWMVQRGLPVSLDTYTQNATVLTVVGLTAYKMFYGGLGIDAPITDKTSLVKPTD